MNISSLSVDRYADFCEIAGIKEFRMRTISITFVFSICTALLLGGPTVQAAAVSCAAPVISTATSSVVELKKDSEPQPREDKPKKSKKNDGKDGDPDDGNSGKGNDDKTLPNDGPAAD